MVIIAAVDDSERAASVVREAEELANAFEDRIHVVHVMERDDFVELEQQSVERTGEAIDIEDVQEVAAEIAADAASDVEADVETVGLMGDPVQQLVTYAADQEARYVVVAGRKRSPAGKVIFGSVSQAVLLNAPCPVVALVEDDLP